MDFDKSQKKQITCKHFAVPIEAFDSDPKAQNHHHRLVYCFQEQSENYKNIVSVRCFDRTAKLGQQIFMLRLNVILDEKTNICYCCFPLARTP